MLIIRLATEDDLSGIMSIVNKVIPIMNSAGNFQWDATYPNEPKFLTDISNQELWVACWCETKHESSAQTKLLDDESNRISKHKVVGVCAITSDQDEGYRQCGWDISIPCVVPHRLAIHPDYQGKGVAQSLLLKAEQIGREKGYRYFRVDTNKLNIPMQTLFKKMGYSYCGEITLSAKAEELRYVCFEKVL
jgi:ribosomal protein S18 acetylase RimI-like enzyme